MRSKIVRIVALMASAALIAGAFATAPALAGKKKGKALKCGQFTAGVEDAASAPVLQVTPSHTEAAPLVVEFEHGAAMPLTAEHIYHNVQVVGPASGLYIREEFDSYSDIDLYLYDAAGEEVASSGAFNQAPVPGVFDADGNGGMGYESINGLATATCAGYTIESASYLTFGTPVTLKIWLGEVQG